jgi:hypothetical protein
METKLKVHHFSNSVKFPKKSKAVFKILVIKAKAKKKIHYSDLMSKERISRRWIGTVVGDIGNYLKKMNVPLLNAIVIRKDTGYPNRNGFGPYIGDDFATISENEYRRRVEAIWEEVFNFEHWDEVSSL